MYDVVGVGFQDKGRVYYFLSNELILTFGQKVIVETERGIQLGTVISENKKIEEKDVVSVLKRVIRIATEEDMKRNAENIKDAEKALNKCRELIEKKAMSMRLIDSTYTFDRSQLLFHFIADTRIDFRDLVKDLASIFHTRIELRQIGVRDKAKEIGGIGSCGRELCCSKFLHDFDSVSINMAKNQNIALNPTKINGACGRLLCCLMYEDDQYSECRKGMPENGAKVKTAEGDGKVISLDIYKQSYRVLLENKTIVEVQLENKCCGNCK